MATKFKFPIRYKILAVLSVVVMAAVAVYLYLASRLFYEDKTVLIYELNQTNVRTLGADVRADFKRVLDKLKLIAALESSASSSQTSAVFETEDELVRVGILKYDEQGKNPVQAFSHIWPKYLESYHKNSAYLEHVRELVPIPFEKVTTRGVWVRNITLAQSAPDDISPPLMTIAVPIESGDAVSKRIIYADVRLDRMLETFGSSGIAQSYAVDSDGRILVDSNQVRIIGAPDVNGDPLSQMAIASKLRSEVKRYEEGGKAYLGSFFQVGLAGVIVASKVEVGQAFAAAERLIRKSLIYAVVVVTAAFLIALIFSHSLTTPIQLMLEATQRIAKGDFESLIRISSRDELATLANSFNVMTVDLKYSRAQIEEYSRDLEKKVLDRTAKLESQNIAIKEAQEALVRTTRLASVGEVAGRAAHEVLNPLTKVSARLEKMQAQNVKADSDDLGLFGEIIGAWTKELSEKGWDGLLQALSIPSTTQTGRTLLEEDIDNLRAIAGDLSLRLSERESDIQFLLRESARISKIVNGMRQLTRVSGNKRPIRIHALLDEALATMNDVLTKHRITTETHFSQGSPLVLADHDELIQVFSNLLRNSMQAIDSKGPQGGKIWFSTAIVEKEQGRLVQIRVGDTGPGIPNEHLHVIFEPTFTTKSAEDGTGLGLSISRRFIRAFDGEIIVEKSIAGVETVFLIELPELVETNSVGQA
jgi:signal transduction histidine kinase